MSYTIERMAACRVSLAAEISAEKVAQERAHVVGGYVKRARIDGFRPGKAPRAVIERRFAAEIKEDLEERLFRLTWDEVKREAKLKPAGPFEVKKTEWREDGSFALAGELDVYPEITLPSLDGFAPPPFELEPTPEEIARELEALRERQAAWEPIEGETVADGMLVEAEVHATFADGSAEPHHNERSLFQVGSGEIFPEVEAAVRGRAIGDEVSAERILGDEAGEEKAGKKVEYRIKIKSLRRKRLPEADDGFAASLGLEGGVAELREALGAKIRANKLNARRETWRDALVRHLGGERPLELPERLVIEEAKEEMAKLASSLQRRGLDLAKADVDWEKLGVDVRQRVEARLRAELLLDALADQRGVTVSDAAVDRELEQQARALGVPFAELKGNMAKRDGIERLRAILRRERVVDDALYQYVGEGRS